MSPTSSEQQISQRDYFLKFNEAYKAYQGARSEDNLALVNRYLALISSILEPKLFDPINTETCLFFINLYELIEQIDAQSSLLWSAIAALQTAIDSTLAKEVNEKFKFVPILVRLLHDVTGRHKVLKVLTILQKLTYMLDLAWNEVYLKNLCKALLKHLASEDEEVVHLTASVLVNVCFKNSPATHCLLKECSADEILGKIGKHTVLRFKMQYILRESRKFKFGLEFSAFVEYVAEEIKRALLKWNSDLMQHIFDFFYDLERNHPQYSEKYSKFDQFIEELLTVNRWVKF